MKCKIEKVISARAERWILEYTITDSEIKKFRFREITFRADNDDAAAAFALMFIKKACRRITRNQFLEVHFSPDLNPCPGERLFRMRDTYKRRQNWKKLSKITNPNKVFVKGMGSQALEELRQ